ncbi:hypothetical protein V1514DRAFT_336505 [Lipomyces japonicus]|uniref:uncharacterized protein n=1 Tax=Lipomyces japonicus TaxID=56871 RepID=UPI0034CD7116
MAGIKRPRYRLVQNAATTPSRHSSEALLIQNLQTNDDDDDDDVLESSPDWARSRQSTVITNHDKEEDVEEELGEFSSQQFDQRGLTSAANAEVKPRRFILNYKTGKKQVLDLDEKEITEAPSSSQPGSQFPGEQIDSQDRGGYGRDSLIVYRPEDDIENFSSQNYEYSTQIEETQEQAKIETTVNVDDKNMIDHNTTNNYNNNNEDDQFKTPRPRRRYVSSNSANRSHINTVTLGRNLQRNMVDTGDVLLYSTPDGTPTRFSPRQFKSAGLASTVASWVLKTDSDVQLSMHVGSSPINQARQSGGSSNYEEWIVAKQNKGFLHGSKSYAGFTLAWLQNKSYDQHGNVKGTKEYRWALLFNDVNDKPDYNSGSVSVDMSKDVSLRQFANLRLFKPVWSTTLDEAQITEFENAGYFEIRNHPHVLVCIRWQVHY